MRPCCGSGRLSGGYLVRFAWHADAIRICRDPAAPWLVTAVDAVLEQVTTLDSYNPELVTAFANVFVQRGEPDAAVFARERSLQRHP